MTGVSIRRAGTGDVDFLLELVTDEDVRPFLSPRTAGDRDTLLEQIERSTSEPDAYGVFVIELDGEPAGSMGFHVSNERSRIARVERLAVHPRFRRMGVADAATLLFQRLLLVELGFHRLELEIFGFNERALAHAERAGFVREGRKRRAYLYGDDWVDSVMFSLLAEDL